MTTKGLIELKTTKATLFLTPEEYAKGLQRGKAILRRRSMQKRTGKPRIGKIYIPDGER